MCACECVYVCVVYVYVYVHVCVSACVCACECVPHLFIIGVFISRGVCVYRIAVSQLKQRGWATYTDLTTIWQASDVEETMLSASKQAAKVCVCVCGVCTNHRDTLWRHQK